ncbi:MAG: hypothetical protein ABW179_09885 [Methylobacterium sp.]
MANLTAVLRKTIDGLPNASPQLRAKVYEKARAAITRQIQAANPQLDEAVVEARYRVLEDAIRETEAHYESAAAAERPPEPASPPEPTSREMRVEAPPPAAPEPASGGGVEATPRVEPRPAPPIAERPAPPAFPRATPTTRPPAQPAWPVASRTAEPAPAPAPETGRTAEPPAGSRAQALRSDPPLRSGGAEPRPPLFSDVEPRVGETGPVEIEGATPGDTASRRLAALRSSSKDGEPERPVPRPAAPDRPSIPAADMSGPRYPARRTGSRRRPPIAAGLTVLALVGLGAAGWLYGDEIRALLTGEAQVASTNPATQPAGTTEEDGEPLAATNGEPPATAAAPVGTASEQAPPAAATPAGVRARQFTQRLNADGTEIDAGPGAGGTNAFEEGTDVATASLNTPAEAPPAATPEAAPAAGEAAPATSPSTPSTPPATAAVPVGQRAVFYEERSTTREGSQRSGNVVWSLVDEAPADGQPPEPAIRAVADVPDAGLKMTLTIRRNADATLPASHVIEVLFETPADFPGGAIENVQRLALKPTEQARGEALIGVAGKISDGFFVIALNDLKSAVDTNLALLGREQWIDVPLAYSSGQRALMSIEKGISGDRVFKQALDAWAAKS